MTCIVGNRMNCVAKITFDQLWDSDLSSISYHNSYQS